MISHNKFYIGVLMSASLLGTSCRKNFETVNDKPNGATISTLYTEFNYVVSSLPITDGEYSVMNAWLYPINQQGVVVGNAYPFNNARTSVWENYYLTLATYRKMQSEIAASADSAQYNNVSAMLRTIMAYKAFKVTNYYGDIPYSKAGYGPLLGGGYFKVAYDKQEDVYKGILADLDWAVDHLKVDASQFSLGSYETFLKGDINKWIEFANSLRLYVAVTMYDKNSTLAGQEIPKSLAQPLLSDANNIGLWPANITGLQFDWRRWSFSANCYLRMGSTMWNLMSNNDATDGSGIFDPRCKLFFETNVSNQWKAYPQNSDVGDGGAPYNYDNRPKDWSNKGTGNNFSNFNFYFEDDIASIPELMLTAAQVHFIKAEVYNRGLGVAANPAFAKTEYENGIKASVSMWKSIAVKSAAAKVWVVNTPSEETITTAEATTLLTNPKIAYNSSNSSIALAQIYAQLWIDQYRQPYDAWTLLRRTGGKTPMASVNASAYTTTYGNFNKFMYPESEQSFNYDNWKVQTGGSDNNAKKIWIQP